jgi:hypothetical protein
MGHEGYKKCNTFEVFKDFFKHADNFALSENRLKPASLPGGQTGGIYYRTKFKFPEEIR